MILAFLGRLIIQIHSYINGLLFEEPQYPDLKNRSSDNSHKFINWNIQHGYDYLYRNTLNSTIYHLSSLNPNHVFLQEVKNEGQARYICHNLDYKDMVFYNGLCFLTNGTIKSTVDYKLGGNAAILNIKLKLGQDSRDYLNIFMVHFTNDLSQTIQANEMTKLIKILHDETELDRERLILLGDFNINHDTFDEELLTKYKLSNKVTAPTYPYLYPFLKLDRIYTNLNINTEILNFNSSDHKAVFGEIILEE
jgi:hypothetical protein